MLNILLETDDGDLLPLSMQSITPQSPDWELFRSPPVPITCSACRVRIESNVDPNQRWSSGPFSIVVWP